MKSRSAGRAVVGALAVGSLVIAAGCSSSKSSTASAGGSGSPAGSTAAAPSAAAATTAAPAASAAASSAAPAPASSAAAGPKVTITFWHSYSADSEEPTLDKVLIPAFEKQYPNVTVKEVDFSHDDLYQKLLTGSAAGELPDVVRSDIAWTPTFAKSGIFAPLDTDMSDFKSLADQTFPGNLSTNLYQGHYYGLPLDTNTRVMLSNMQAFAAAGITSAPKTFADMLADAPKLKAKGIYLYGDGGTGGWNVLPWIWSAGGSLTNDDNTTATGYINSAASVSAVQMLTTLYKEGAIPSIMLGAQGGLGTSDGVPKGKYAMTLDGPWMNPIWAGSYPNFKFEQDLVPAGPGGSISVVGGEDINMVASTKNKQAVEEFISYMLSSDAQLAMTKVGQLSVRKDLQSQLTAIQPYYGTFLQQLATAKARTPVPNYPQIDQIVTTQVANAMSGKETPQKAMDEAAAQIDPLLK
jgi:multiple sugar transport system substrate-binding protein